MRKTLLISMSVLLVIVILFVSMLLLTIKGSKGCYSFVIDSTEIHTGLDIPEVKDARCFKLTRQDIRVGYYVLDQEFVDINEYAKKFGFGDTRKQSAELLQTMQDLIQFGAPLPHEKGSYLVRTGKTEHASWQNVLDIESGELWIEIQW